MNNKRKRFFQRSCYAIAAVIAPIIAPLVAAIVVLGMNAALVGCDTTDLPLVSQPSATPTTAPPTPTPEPTPIGLDATLHIEASGFRLRYPQGWETIQGPNTLSLAPDTETLQATNPGEKLVVLIDWTPLSVVTDEETDQAEARLSSLFQTSSEGPRQAGYSVGNTIPITVDGKMALYADLEAEGGTGRLVVLLAPPHVVRFLGQSLPAAWDDHKDLFERIVESVSFDAPETIPTSPPPPPPTPTPANRAMQPQTITQGPPGFLLRLGSNEGERNRRFISARGLTTAPDGTVYLAESSRGVWVFAPDGTLETTFGEDELIKEAYDVAYGPGGELYVADYGRNAIARFNPDGTLAFRWGEIGEGEDQFGLQTPQRIAVGTDGSVYALDSHIDFETQSTVNSVIRFRGEDGQFLNRITLASGLSPNDLAVDSMGNVYLADAATKEVVVVNHEEKILTVFGENVLEGGITAGAIDLDRMDNIYVATWDAGILKLASDGTLVASGGSIAKTGELPEPGQFSLPNGIAVAPGGVVWVSDNNGEYSAITALRLLSDDNTPATMDNGHPAATQGMTPTTSLTSTGEITRQWAISATASSSYGDDYGPDGATGPPDVEGCTDSSNAWASAAPDTLETLELTYKTPVFASQINIYQNHQPGFVSSVEVRDERGRYTTIYTGTARLQNVCPYVQEISFSPPIFRIVGVKLTIDQRRDANWSEVDAVELIGVP